MLTETVVEAERVMVGAEVGMTLAESMVIVKSVAVTATPLLHVFLLLFYETFIFSLRHDNGCGGITVANTICDLSISSAIEISNLREQRVRQAGRVSDENDCV